MELGFPHHCGIGLVESGSARGETAFSAVRSREGDEGVAHAQGWKAGEVAIGSEQLAHSVIKTQGSDLGIMKATAGRATIHDERAQCLEVRRGFMQRDRTRARKPMLDLVERSLVWSGLGEDACACDHRQELLKHGPAQPNLRRAPEGPGNDVKCALVRGQVRAMCIYENVGVECDHRCIARSRSSAQVIDIAVGDRPPDP